ncbi:MAG TPA: sigma-70 family RNA polymerase sigma factor [Longimicrobiaceae bacterium]|nr:sigma-70 family RNA polymerase sigma factor [Longimicrobiaceae bacterium]
MDADAFAEALRPHYDDAARYCRALCARWSPGEADDVLQQALLQALEHHGSLRDPAKFRSWLFRIVTQCFHAAARRHFWRRFVPLAEADEAGAMPAVLRGRPDAPGRAALLSALGRLPDRDRAALLLFEVAGLSLEEVGAVQGDRSLSATKSRLSRARRRARALLEAGGRPDAAAPREGVEEATLRLLNEIDAGRER